MRVPHGHKKLITPLAPAVVPNIKHFRHVFEWWKCMCYVFLRHVELGRYGVIAVAAANMLEPNRGLCVELSLGR